MSSVHLTQHTDIALPASPYPLSTKHDFIAITVFDTIGRFSGFLAALGLLTMALMMCYEIVVRYVFNSPTAWVTEISTYLLVAVVFLGLACAQRNNSHVQVELWVDRLSRKSRLTIEQITQWISLFFVGVLGWQMASFNVREFVNGTRDWGLLSTPQWIPEMSVSVGLGIFVLSILVDLYRLHPPEKIWRKWLVPVGLIALVASLVSLGRLNVQIQGTRFDWGTLLILFFVISSAFVWGSVRVACLVSALIGGFSILFWLANGQSLLVVGLILIFSMMFMLLLGIRIASALGFIGLLGVYFLLSRPQLSLIAERAWSSTNTFTLSAVPMFILMGALMLRSGVVTGMFDALVRWFGRTPGGLAHASAGASAVFAAVCGSSLATAATLGKVACPEMINRGYSVRLSYGITAAGATLGVLIPPSIPMIIYGTAIGASVTHLFIAGVIPGLLLMFVFMATAFIWALFNPHAAPATRAYTLKEKIQGSRGVAPFLFIILIVLGSMYAGVATPTEAAALGAIGAFVLCLTKRQINWSILLKIAIDTAQVTAMVLFIVVGASIFSWVVDFLRIPREMVAVIGKAGFDPWIIFAVMVLMYLILGMFVESIAMMLMTLPVTFPIAVAMGLDPIWFGVFMVLMIEVGLITPPLGMILFVLRSMDERVKFTELISGATPFVIIMVAFVILLYIFPQIVTWLPGKIG